MSPRAKGPTRSGSCAQPYDSWLCGRVWCELPTGHTGLHRGTPDNGGRAVSWDQGSLGPLFDVAGDAEAELAPRGWGKRSGAALARIAADDDGGGSGDRTPEPSARSLSELWDDLERIEERVHRVRVKLDAIGRDLSAYKRRRGLA